MLRAASRLAPWAAAWLLLPLPGRAADSAPTHSAGRAPEPSRVALVFALDPLARDSASWRREIEAALEEANRALGPHLSARFELAEVVAWSGAEGSLAAGLDTLRSLGRHGQGQVVAGISQRARRGSTGLASYREGLLVLDKRPGGGWQRLLTHELAHLFGAVHLPGTPGLMAENGPGAELDSLNARIVAVHRDRRFAPHLFPLPLEALEPARALYRQAAEQAPEAQLHLAQLALELGDPAGALEAAERLLRRDAGDDEARFLQGIALRRLGRPAEAVATYREILRRRPRYAPAHFSLAIALDRLGQAKAAVDAYEQAIAHDPRHVAALSNLARLHTVSGAPELGVSAARRALELAPDYAEARVNLAMAHLEAGAARVAEAEARRAVLERPELPEAHEALGAALLAAGRPGEAAGCFEAAQALQPGEIRYARHLSLARRALARERRRHSDLDAALEALQGATAAAPEDPEAWSELAELGFELGRAAEAREAYLRLLELRPSDAAAHNNLALILFRAGEIAAARRHVTEALRLGLEVHPQFLEALTAAERR